MKKEDKLSKREKFFKNKLIRRKKIDPSPSKKELDEIREYLENPTKNGVWNLEISRSHKLKKLLKEKLEEGIKKRGENSPEGKRLRIRENELSSSFDKFSFVFAMFKHLCEIEKNGDSFDKYAEIEDSEYRIILEIVDSNKIKEELKDAFEYFKENIYLKNLKPKIRKDHLTKIKGGFIYFSKEETFYEIESSIRENLYNEIDQKEKILALNKETLDRIKSFLKKAEFIEGGSIYPTFSPEEEVFVPYFSFLEKAYPIIIANKHIRRLFDKSISEYNDGKNVNCIATIGLITEDYLIQIYETLFRETHPKKPLGELYDQLHKKIKKELGNNPGNKRKLDFSKYFEKIKRMEQSQGTKEDIASVLREIVTLTKEAYSINRSKIEDLNKNQKETSIFNKELRDNLNEIIKYRNATSHRSRVPIGDYEALRSVYGCINLILWWKKQKQNIDWTKNKKEILKKVIEDNNY